MTAPVRSAGRNIVLEHPFGNCCSDLWFDPLLEPPFDDEDEVLEFSEFADWTPLEPNVSTFLFGYIFLYYKVVVS